MKLRAKFVLLTPAGTWVREAWLPIPPFPGLGIRLDVYDLLNVRSVVVGDHGFDVTCIVEIEDPAPGEVTPAKLAALGFEEGPYP